MGGVEKVWEENGRRGKKNLGCPSMFAPRVPIPQSERKAHLQIPSTYSFELAYQIFLYRKS